MFVPSIYNIFYNYQLKNQKGFYIQNKLYCPLKFKYHLELIFVVGMGMVVSCMIKLLA